MNERHDCDVMVRANPPERFKYAGVNERREEDDGLVIDRDLAIPMRDGVVIRADLYRGCDGTEAMSPLSGQLRSTSHSSSGVRHPRACRPGFLISGTFEDVSADLLAVNPPQRPASILDAVEPDQRHLHEGGGPDRLETVRLVLRHVATSVVRTTAAAVRPIADACTAMTAGTRRQ